MGYTGNAIDQARIRRLEREREEDKKRVEDLKQKTAAQPAGFRIWQTGTQELVETAFKKETIGLVTKEEYVNKKATIEARLEAEGLKRKRADEDAAVEARAKQQAGLLKQRHTAKLSFAEEVHDNEAEEDSASEFAALPRLKKDDDVRTDFLPDVDREREKEDLRNKLKQEWRDQQEKLKARELHIDYSYWDGSGHRRHATVKVGDKITDLLKIAREQLGGDFQALRRVSVDNLIFVKDDVILPQTLTFYDLIAGKVQGKLGPLFSEADLEREDAEQEGRHAAKVVERHWYEQSKHIFPANRWSVYDVDGDLPGAHN